MIETFVLDVYCSLEKSLFLRYLHFFFKEIPQCNSKEILVEQRRFSFKYYNFNWPFFERWWLTKSTQENTALMCSIFFGCLNLITLYNIKECLGTFTAEEYRFKNALSIIRISHVEYILLYVVHAGQFPHTYIGYLRQHAVFLLQDAESTMDRIYEQQSSLNKNKLEENVILFKIRIRQ